MFFNVSWIQSNFSGSLFECWGEVFPLQGWRCWSGPCWGWPSCCCCAKSLSASCASPSRSWWTASTRSSSSSASLWLLKAPAEPLWAPLRSSMQHHCTLPTSLLGPPSNPTSAGRRPLPGEPSGRSLPQLWGVVCPTDDAGFPSWAASSPRCSWPRYVSLPLLTSLAFSWRPSRSGSPCCSWLSVLPAFSWRRCFSGFTGISSHTLCCDWTEKVMYCGIWHKADTLNKTYLLLLQPLYQSMKICECGKTLYITYIFDQYHIITWYCTNVI